MVSRTNKAHSIKIVNDPLFKEYVHFRNLKPETIRSYSRKLTIYSMVTGLTPTELIEEAEMDEDQGIRKRLRRIKIHLTDLQDHLITMISVLKKLKISSQLPEGSMHIMKLSYLNAHIMHLFPIYK